MFDTMIVGRNQSPLIYSKGDGSLNVIVVDYQPSKVVFITLTVLGDANHPKVELRELPLPAFEKAYRPIRDDVVAIAKIYEQYTKTQGATPGALETLKQIINFTKGTKNMDEIDLTTATTPADAPKEKPSKKVKQAEPAAPKKVKDKKPKLEPVTSVAVGVHAGKELNKKQAAAGKTILKDIKDKGQAIVEKAVKSKKELEPSALAQVAAKKPPTGQKFKDMVSEGGTRLSVSGRFCQLILENQLPDSEIWAIVKKEYNLEDHKRGYVSWNRNKLRKNGQLPIGHKPVPERTI